MKNKTIWFVILLILIIRIAYYIGAFKGATPKQPAKVTTTDTIVKQLPPVPVFFDPKNATYTVDDTRVTLVNGQVDTPVAPGSAEVMTTQYFGNLADGDLNGDGIPDSAFLITQYGAGTGEFYYVVAVLKTTTSYKVTNTVFIGDRIAPQTTEINNGVVLVNYADRTAGQAMTDTPTVGVTKHYKVNSSGMLVEVIK